MLGGRINSDASRGGLSGPKSIWYSFHLTIEAIVRLNPRFGEIGKERTKGSESPGVGIRSHSASES
ncbi:multidrug oligosaccharidyl-lipid polysaccharide flippase [Moniliophthora roreri]|nr:multidrug oligosaccharidyl-lipid polysaccharide flippase [Moniliophthora roreri]